jgi:hypothetical protein
VGLGQAGADGVVVAVQAVGEAVQVGLVVGLDRGDPVVELVAAALDKHLGETSDVRGGRGQRRGAVEDLLQRRGVVGLLRTASSGAGTAGWTAGSRASLRIAH